MPITPLMKDKLVRRDEIDAATKKANEYHIRKHIINYLEDLEEILWILDTLPERQVKKLFKDEDVFRILELAERALIYLDFKPVWRDNEGQLIAGKTIIADPECGSPRNYSDGDQATDHDLARFGALRKYLARFTKFERPGPWALYAPLDRVYYKDLIKKAQKEGCEPANPGETPDRLWIPRLSESAMRFRNTQRILTGLGFEIDSPEDLKAIRERNRLDRLRVWEDK